MKESKYLRRESAATHTLLHRHRRIGGQVPREVFHGLNVGNVERDGGDILGQAEEGLCGCLNTRVLRYNKFMTWRGGGGGGA